MSLSRPTATRARLTLTGLEGRDCPAGFRLSVPATANIFGAGHAVAPEPDGKGGGTLPPQIDTRGAGDGVVTFPSVTGTVTVSTIAPYPYADADGTTVATGDTDILSFGGIAGIRHSNRGMFLIGVFLTDAEPVGAGPARLSFRDPEVFAELRPEIGQTFFIGDGRADDTGLLQRFHVPTAATRLFLGFADSFDFGDPEGLPGWYYDNAGAVSVEAAVGDEPDSCVAALSQQFAFGGPTAARLVNPDQTERQSVSPFPGFTGGVRTAAADFTGDGVADLVVGTGPGVATRVVAYDGVSRAVLADFAPFEAAFTGGLYVAAGDLTGDGKAELVVTPDQGGGPRVRAFSGSGFAPLADFLGIVDTGFRGGARAAVGDVDGDGLGDVAVAAGFGGGPRVSIWSGRAVTADGGQPAGPLANFFAFEPSLRNGAFVAAGDFDGDCKAELVAGGGPGGGPRVRVFAGADVVARPDVPPDDRVQLANFFAGDPTNRDGVRLTVKNLDGDDRADLVTGAGSGTRVTAYGGAAVAAGGTPAELFSLDAGGDGRGGVFVG